MHLLKTIGRFCAHNERLENILVSLGHRYPYQRVVNSLCYHAGESAVATKHGDTERVAHLRNGSAISVTLEEHAFRYIYFYGIYEPEVTSVIEHVARPGQTWLDVGGNIGFYTILLSSLVGETGTVHVFEPNPVVADRIARSIELGKRENISLNRLAVSDTSGDEAVLHIPVSESARASLIAHRDFTRTREVRVLTVALDDYIREKRLKVDFMKIDIEGLEILAFRGMAQTLKAAPPKIIFCEANQYPDSAATPRELVSHLIEYGYVPYRIREQGLLAYDPGSTLHPQLDKDIAFVASGCTDLVAGLIRKDSI